MLNLKQLNLEVLKNKFKNLLNFCKEKKWYIYIYFLFFLSLILGEFSLLRLFIFLIVLIYIIIYTRLLCYLETFLNDNKWIFNYSDNILKKQFIFLIKIDGIKNPFLLLISIIDNKLFDFLRKLNYKLIKYNNINLLLWINILIISFINPFNLIFTKFYILFIKWKKFSLFQILTSRMLSAVLNLLIYTQILGIMIKYFSWIYIFLIIYILLYLISVVKLREACIKGSYLLDFIKIYNLEAIKKDRKKVTLFGIYLSCLYEFINFRDINIDTANFKNMYYCMDFFYLNNFKERLFLEKMLGIPSWFYMSKEFGIWKEIKNRPSFFVYTLFSDKLSILLRELPCFVYVYLFMLNDINNKDLEIFLVMYKIQLLYIKLLFFYKLDVEFFVNKYKDNQLVWNQTNKAMFFSYSEKLSKSDFIIEDKNDDEFFDIYLNDLFYEKFYYFLNIEEFQYSKNNRKINLNIELFSNIVKNNKEKINKFLDIFIVSAHELDIEDNVKKYIYNLIEELKESNKLSRKIEKKEKYFSLLNELEFLFYELVIINNK